MEVVPKNLPNIWEGTEVATLVGFDLESDFESKDKKPFWKVKEIYLSKARAYLEWLERTWQHPEFRLFLREASKRGTKLWFYERKDGNGFVLQPRYGTVALVQPIKCGTPQQLVIGMRIFMKKLENDEFKDVLYSAYWQQALAQKEEKEAAEDNNSVVKLAASAN